MTELYSNQQLSAIKSAIKRFACAAVAIFIFTFAICTIVCFLVNRNNAVWLKSINIVVSTVGGCVAIYLIFNTVLPLVAQKNDVQWLLYSVRKTIVGIVEITDVQLTVSKHISVRELNVTTENSDKIILYWDNAIPFPNINGKQVVFHVVNNRIVAYGITNENCN